MKCTDSPKVFILDRVQIFLSIPVSILSINSTRYCSFSVVQQVSYMYKCRCIMHNAQYAQVRQFYMFCQSVSITCGISILWFLKFQGENQIQNNMDLLLYQFSCCMCFSTQCWKSASLMQSPLVNIYISKVCYVTRQTKI